VHWRVLEVPWGASAPSVKATRTDRIDMREHVIDFGKQEVITKDTVQVSIDALVYFRVTDPRAAVFRVANLPDAVALLTQATLRDLIAQMTLDDTFSSREAINSVLLAKVQRDAERWGVQITRCEIQDISPPSDIAEAMEKQIEAERERRSEVLRADGDRESKVIRSRGEAARVVLTAEGERASEVLRAQGVAEAKRVLAAAEAQSLAAIRAAVTPFGVRGVDYMAAIEYLNSLSRLTYNAAGSRVTLVPVDAVERVQAAAKA
jgi:regulator of protease activity HflC (stomatin/prohibitin superfamily)